MKKNKILKAGVCFCCGKDISDQTYLKYFCTDCAFGTQEERDREISNYVRPVKSQSADNIQEGINDTERSN